MTVYGCSSRHTSVGGSGQRTGSQEGRKLQALVLLSQGRRAGSAEKWWWWWWWWGTVSLRGPLGTAPCLLLRSSESFSLCSVCAQQSQSQLGCIHPFIILIYYHSGVVLVTEVPFL